jgi:glycosyltransferase involved in cell wall biosynthesis
MGRATKEKGLERTLKLLDMFDQAKKDYVLIICSRVDPYGELWPVIEANPRILYMPSSIYNDVLYRCADYLIQLSDLESWCYTLREAIANGVAILGNDIPEIAKVVKDGENGYLLKPDLSNVDLDKIFNNVPKPTGKTEKVPAIWQKVMEGKL